MRVVACVGRALVAAVALLAVGATAAKASTTIGNPLEATGFGDAPCGVSCTTTLRLTMLQTLAGTEGGSYASPINGTIVRWRIQTYEGSSPSTTIWLRVIRRVSGETFTGEGTGSPETLSSETATQTFPVDLPIKAGEYIGLDQDSTGHFFAYGANGSSQVGTNFTEFIFALADGAEREPTYPLEPPCSSNCSSLLINADVAALPTSSATLPATCASSGATPVTVTSDPDPATPPKAVHYRIDAGPESTLATTGNPGVATITVPTGAHTLEYWGEDGAGGLEAAHHTASLDIGPCASPLLAPVVIHGTVAPQITLARLSSTTFRAASSGGSLARKRKPPVGTTVSYTDSETATTTFTVLKRVGGHRSGRKCVAGHARKHQHACTVLVVVGSFTHADTAGAVSVHFTGRVGGHKLRPGRYTLKLSPQKISFGGRSVSLAFRIVR